MTEGIPKTRLALSALSNFILAGSQWLILVLIAKMGTPEWVGHYAYATAVITPVYLLSGLQLRSVWVTEVDPHEKIGYYLLLRWISISAGFLFLLVFALVANEEIPLFFFWIFSLSKGLELFGDFMYGVFQKSGQFNWIAASTTWRSLTMLAGSYLVLSAGWGLTGVATVSLVTQAAVFTFYDLPRARQEVSLTLLYDAVKLKALFRTSLPLGLVMILGSFGTYLPRYVLEHTHGFLILGYFGALSHLLMASNTFVNAVGQVLANPLARDFASGHLSRFLRRIFLASGMVGIVGAVLVFMVMWKGKMLLEIIYTKEYREYADALLWISVTAILSGISSLAGYALTAARAYRTQLRLNVPPLLLLLPFSLWVIAEQGVLGAAFALLFYFAVQIPIRGIALFRILARQRRHLSSKEGAAG